MSQEWQCRIWENVTTRGGIQGLPDRPSTIRVSVGNTASIYCIYAGQEHTTENLRMNDAFMMEDAVWDTGVTNQKAESNLQRKLEVCFTRKLGETTYKKCHEVMKKYILDAGVGNMRGMEYKTFTEYMGNRRVSKRCISAGVMRGIEDFITHYESGDQCTEY